MAWKGGMDEFYDGLTCCSRKMIQFKRMDFKNNQTYQSAKDQAWASL